MLEGHGSLELENAEALRAGSVKPLAVLSTESLEIEGASGSSEFDSPEFSGVDVLGSSGGERWKAQWSLRH
jgi:hypothetical protein